MARPVFQTHDTHCMHLGKVEKVYHNALGKRNLIKKGSAEIIGAHGNTTSISCRFYCLLPPAVALAGNNQEDALPEDILFRNLQHNTHGKQ